jgi:hypothetical protein
MLEIFTRSNRAFHKVIVSDVQIDTVEDAKQRVKNLSLERNWKPSFEIDIQKDSVGENDSVLFSIRVGYDEGRDDGIERGILKCLSGKESTGWIKTELGYPGYEGWESAIEENDLFELPNVWFSRSFIRDFISPETCYENHSWSVFDEAHKQLLLPKLEEQTKKALKRKSEQLRETDLPGILRDYYQEQIPHYEQLLTSCRDITRGKASFAEIVNTCNTRLSII